MAKVERGNTFVAEFYLSLEGVRAFRVYSVRRREILENKWGKIRKNLRKKLAKDYRVEARLFKNGGFSRRGATPALIGCEKADYRFREIRKRHASLDPWLVISKESDRDFARRECCSFRN